MTDPTRDEIMAAFTDERVQHVAAMTSLTGDASDGTRSAAQDH